MPKLREQLGLGDAAHDADGTWMELRRAIDRITYANIDLYGEPISPHRHKNLIEFVAERICIAFADLFSDPISGKTSRVLLEQYITSNGNLLRLRERQQREKCLEIHNSPSTSTLRPRRVRTRRRGAHRTSAREDGQLAIQSNPCAFIQDHHRDPQEAVMLEATADEIPPQPSWDSLWYPPFCGLHHNEGPGQPVIRSETPSEPIPPHHQRSNPEHEELHDFLALCKPSLTHLYPYLVAYGCTDMVYIRVMSEWSDSDLQTVLANIKTIEAVDGKPVKPIDWDVLRHSIRKLNVH
ncbi:hypothetical protein BDN72DRAFT_964738 [Pluteus cervinus]|uniref:Uncharacterized protein n=1 Tax=Pluteus cervinus TaxID=181527 RepID=A0ACD3A9S1_9AGAR|nr:hypothetical protein BDN72DRAFT_964738 [Pluteus cervinus]